MQTQQKVPEINMAKLVINPGTPQAREFELKAGANYLGRGFANDITIEDPSVSSSHAQVTLANGTVTVKDLGSTNGTFVNRAPVTSTILQPGQFLRLGGVEMLFDETPGSQMPLTNGFQAAAVPAIAVVPAPQEAAFRVAEPAAAVVTIPPAPTINAGGLRIASSGPATTISAAPPLAPPIDGPPPLAPPPLAPPILAPANAAQAAKKSVCRFHPKSPARWLCPQCGQMYCDLCVGTRKAAEGTGYFCRPCGAQCSPVGLSVHVEAAKVGSFFSMIPEAFAYPFKNGGWLILVCATLFLGLLDFLASASKFGGLMLFMRTLMLQVIFLGYLFAYMQSIIQNTARGDESEPSLPDITNFLEDILIPCGQFLATILFSFAPVLAVITWYFNGGAELAGTAVLPSIILGCLYFPMGFLAVAMFDTVTALNPMLVVPSIMKVSLQYLTACLLLGLVVLIRAFGAKLLRLIIPVMFVPDIISSFVGIYFLTVQCRILGLLYLTNRQRLGWFKR
jgi:hypothetical protein